MTVQELMERLSNISDKSIVIAISDTDETWGITGLSIEKDFKGDSMAVLC